MSEKSKARGLGRGLSALMADMEPISESELKLPEGVGERLLPIEALYPNRDQPRVDFDEQDLDELAASIEEKGVIQPVIVRAHPERAGAYQIVAGERRWRAAQRARLHTIPAVIRDLSDRDVLEIALIENIQRKDLNPIEEAQAYKGLIDKFDYTQEQLAKVIGKSRAHIANVMRLMGLSEAVKTALKTDMITMGHARALLTAQNPEGLLQEIVTKGFSVRETERRAKNITEPATLAKAPRWYKDADTKALEAEVSATLGLPVVINQKPGKKTGAVSISYKSLDELESLVSLLCQKLM